MNQIRNEKKDNFTILDNHFIRDDTLSWKAKGLLAYLLHLPIDWVVSMEDLKKRATNGKESTNNGIKELIEKGYITRVQLKVKGKFSGYDYTVMERPFTGNQFTQKQTLLSTNILSTKELSTNKDLLVSFELFWNVYDKRDGKKKCIAKWIKLKDKDRIDILNVVGNYVKMHDVKQYRPNPLTFLNGELWNDEIILPVKLGNNGKPMEENMSIRSRFDENGRQIKK